MVGPGRPQFVLFGSSIVQMSLVSGGWGSILGDLYDRKADIILRGYYGWNSRNALEVLNKIFPQDAAVHPSLAIVYFGGNDASQPHPSGLGSHVPLPEYVENMKKIAFHLKSLGEKLRIIFLTTPPVHEGKILQYYGNKFDKQERTNEACRAYSEALVELCKQMDIKVIDLCKGFQHRHDWGAAYLSGVELAYASRRCGFETPQSQWEPIFICAPMCAHAVRASPSSALPRPARLCRVRASHLPLALSVRASDGIHLSEGGSKFLAKEILKVLREAEWKPSLYWLSMASEFSDDSPYYTVAPDGKTTDNLSYFMPPWKIEWMEQSEVEAMIASKTPVTK